MIAASTTIAQSSHEREPASARIQREVGWVSTSCQPEPLMAAAADEAPADRARREVAGAGQRRGESGALGEARRSRRCDQPARRVDDVDASDRMSPDSRNDVRKGASDSRGNAFDEHAPPARVRKGIAQSRVDAPCAPAAWRSDSHARPESAWRT